MVEKGIVSKITEVILRSDVFYRLLQKGPRPAIYKEISQRAYQHLYSMVLDSAEQFLSSEDRFRELSTQLLTETWQIVLGESELNALAINVQQYPMGTSEFQKAIDMMYRAFLLSNRLKRRPDFASEEAYREAKSILQLWICKNIHKFDPGRGEFIKWINFNFDKNHIPKATELIRKRRFGSPIGDYDFDLLPNPSSLVSNSHLVDWLQEDYISRIPNRDKPDITFCDITLARIQNKKWKDISKQFGFKRLSTPSNFFQSWLDKFTKPLLDEKAESSLYMIRLARFEGESWERIAYNLQIDKDTLIEEHQKYIEKFPSYRDITRNPRYLIHMADYPNISFAKIVQILLGSGHIWKEPANKLEIAPMLIKKFYLESLDILWPPKQ